MNKQTYVEQAYSIFEEYLNVKYTKDDFVQSVLDKQYPCREYRIGGVFGFGGKCYIQSDLSMRVSFHPMDCPSASREEWEALNRDVNQLLNDLYNTYLQAQHQQNLKTIELQTTAKPIKYYRIGVEATAEPGVVNLTKTWGLVSGSSPVGETSESMSIDNAQHEQRRLAGDKIQNGYVDVSTADADEHYSNSENSYVLRVSQEAAGPNIGLYKLEWFNTNDMDIASKISHYGSLALAVVARSENAARLLQHGYQRVSQNTPENPTQGNPGL